MTFFHFLNCMALTYAPFFILYNTSNLSEHNALQSCVMAGVWFGATEVVKIVSMATFFPADALEGLTISVEFGRMIVTGVELLGLYVSLKKTPFLGKYPPKLRVLAVGLGWSFTESILSYLIPLWMGARGEEFSWDYIEMGILSNVNMLMHLGLTGAVWLFSRRDLTGSARTVVASCCIGYITLPTIARVAEMNGTSHFHALVGRGVFALVVGILIRSQLTRYTKH